MTSPIGKLVCYNAVTARDIHCSHTRLKAFRYNASLYIIRPTPVTATGLNDVIATNKSIIQFSFQIRLEPFAAMLKKRRTITSSVISVKHQSLFR
ncbi:hypothetical protein FHT76_007610 [Rhizobium sp. BK176]|nr:hypothetical protein [Rhizobium sp. BK661]MCS4095889.1 hypothetical protein [Rhizobium sp. BK176]